MEFKIIMFEGTDSIKFGMKSKEIQAILGVTPRRFKRFKHDIYETEGYRDMCHVYYEANDRCSAFEFMGSSRVFLNNIQLIGEQYSAMLPLFKDYEGSKDDSCGFLSVSNDFGVYVSKDIIESVYISRKAYTSEREEFDRKVCEKGNRYLNNSQQPKSKLDCMLYLMLLYNMNLVIIGDIFSKVTTVNEYLECFKKVKENSAKYNSEYEFLIKQFKVRELKAQQLISINNELLAAFEKSSNLIKQGDVQAAKSFLGNEHQRLFSIFASTFEDFEL